MVYLGNSDSVSFESHQNSFAVPLKQRACGASHARRRRDRRNARGSHEGMRSTLKHTATPGYLFEWYLMFIENGQRRASNLKPATNRTYPNSPRAMIWHSTSAAYWSAYGPLHSMRDMIVLHFEVFSVQRSVFSPTVCNGRTVLWRVTGSGD